MKEKILEASMLHQSRAARYLNLALKSWKDDTKFARRMSRCQNENGKALGLLEALDIITKEGK